ncbi:nucleotidyltransferase domain-containing protein [Ralstonia solanacearum species complex bacterium KE056]|uniref:nucleotidyltransferase domain-containing protein n=1 Tax=Ralstonia solanacearum species complex bacterium KE056 TaxID=3119585 RepID=UPI002FC3D1C1
MKSASLHNAMDRHGLTDKDLLEEVLSAVPQACAVVVTGSLAADFGNEHSDIDLVCIVPDGQFSQLPIMVYRDGAKIDCEYWLLPDLMAAMDRVSGADLLQGVGHFQEWKKLTRSLQFLIKLSVAYSLHVTESIQPLWDYVHSQDFKHRIQSWWSLEALRLMAAARHALPSQPRFANNLYSEAVLAALSSQATEQSLLFGKKWLGEKLRRSSNETGLALYHLALELPCGDEVQVRERCQELDRMLGRFSVLEPWLCRANALSWWLTPAARLNKFADCLLLWQGKVGYEFPRKHPAESWCCDQPLQTGEAAVMDDSDITLLFKDGLVWPGLAFSSSTEGAAR